MTHGAAPAPHARPQLFFLEERSEPEPEPEEVYDLRGSFNLAPMAKNLKAILRNLSPSLRDGDFVFATFPSMLYGERADLKPVAAVREQEGLTLIIPRREADKNGVNYDGVYKMITLEVHSSLEAVGA